MKNTLVLINDSKYVLGFLELSKQGLVFYPSLESEASKTTEALGRALDSFYVSRDMPEEDGSWILVFQKKDFNGESDLPSLLQNLKSYGLFTYEVSKVLEEALGLVNTMDIEEARAEALQHLLYVPSEEAEAVAKNFKADLA